MTACKHTEWLTITAEDGWATVRQTGRLRSLIRSLSSPSTQKPGLVLMMESRSQSSPAMSEHSSKARAGSIHVALEPLIASHSHPTLVAHAFPVQLRRRARLRRATKCCTTVSQQRLHVSAEDLETLVYSRFLFPFVDAFCFVYHTDADLNHIITYLLSWVEVREEPSVYCVLPEIVIVVTKDGTQKSEASDKLHAGILNQGGSDLSDLFSGVHFLKMKSEDLLSHPGLSSVKKSLGRASSRMRRQRETRGLLFSADHTLGFIETAFQSLPLDDPFHFVKAARLRNPVPPDLRAHLTRLVNAIEDWEDDFAVETIASSLFLDHYTPDMHAFKPTDVFHTLYEDACEELTRTASADHVKGFLLPSAFVNSVLKYMKTFYRKYLTGASAADIHIETLRKHASTWARIRSTKTCFACLRRVPEYKLECGHSLCEHSVETLGVLSDGPRLDVVVKHCFLCQAESQCTVRLRPPTAGVGVLCLDGGGVRAVVTTTILELLEQRIGLPIPIQEYFQLALGISAGAITIPALFLKGWTPAQCTSTLEKLAGTVFKNGPLSNYPVLAVASKILMVLFNDAIYRAKHLERVLKEIYGAETGMLDISHATKNGTKIALPVATTSEPSTLLLTNYNGTGEQEFRNGEFIRRCRVHRGDGDVKVWEAIRGCSAAPGYFTPMRVSSAGQVMDHGVLQNNPSFLALSEFKAKYSHLRSPQFLMNVGTGSSRREDKRERQWGGILRENPVFRLFDAYMSVISGRRTWQDVRRSVTKSSPLSDRCMRLDVEFDGPEPKLDDVGSIPKLKDMVRTDYALLDSVDNAGRYFIASLFYFELDYAPEYGSDGWSGTGTIRCLQKQGDLGLPALTTKLSRLSAKFVVNDVEVRGDVVDSSFRDQTGNFSKRVSFTGVNNIDLLLKEKGRRGVPIGGAPFTIKQLMSLQGLDAPFGTDCHKRRQMSPKKRPCGREGGLRRSKRLCRRLRAIHYE